MLLQFAILVSVLTSGYALKLGRIYVSELFSTKIEPQMFNWTFGQPNQFQYRASLKGYPDLPSWMRYMYSTEYYAGYLYGTPPPHISGREVKPLLYLFLVYIFYIIYFIHKQYLTNCDHNSRIF